MSSLGHNSNFAQSMLHRAPSDSLQVNGFPIYSARSRTPNGSSTPSSLARIGNITGPEAELAAEEDPKSSVFRDLYARTEARLNALFEGGSESSEEPTSPGVQKVQEDGRVAEGGLDPVAALAKKPARTIDEDNYDDSDEEEEEHNAAEVSPLKSKSTGATTVPQVPLSIVPVGLPLSSAPAIQLPQAPGKTSEDARKQFQEDKKVTEDAAKLNFLSTFPTTESDRDSMLDQKKLEESDRQVDVELSGSGPTVGISSSSASGNGQLGTLSQTNLGASSLTLKHLIARIDAKRNRVVASDAELRSLLSEARKGRSKWHSEDRIGQEELYESAEKVLSELKAMTAHSTAFLTKVNKKEAPDYYNVIKHPMDLGTMTKKLKNIQYKSKQEFVEDLNLVWSNCLKYNANPEHFLRRHALFMRKETEKIVPLIPPIVIKDRAEVEAEERRLQNGDADLDGGEDSDDEPIISSRGRKAPGKKTKKGSSAPRKAPPGVLEGSPSAETKPSIQGLNSATSGSNLKNEFLRADSDTIMEGSQNGLFTPPPGTITPAGANGILGNGAAGSQHESMDIDGDSTINGTGPGNAASEITEEVEYEDPADKMYKQLTKKDRALVCTERHRLFKGDRINPEEPALLRNKQGMRRELRRQKEIEKLLGRWKPELEVVPNEKSVTAGETLAEGMEGQEEKMLPDSYDYMTGVPMLPPRLGWIEDAEGNVQDTTDKFLRIVPKGLWTAAGSNFSRKMEANMRQMQETRKVCSKIGVVKQMQLQSHMYQNQFQKYEPEPFVEHDIEPHVMSDDGPLIDRNLTQAALKRSVGKVFFHAGFDEYQPSAIDAMTEITSEYFLNLCSTLNECMQAPKVPIATAVPSKSGMTEVRWKEKLTTEEMILHSLHENGTDLESLESYIKDDVERLGGKLTTMHDRMKSHLADLLRPALTDAGPDGSNAFNDGSEQFVGGDFAEDLDEDFFGFKELGLDKEFGLASLSVPLHLLQNRMHTANQAQNTSQTPHATQSFPPPPPWPPMSLATLATQPTIVHSFFLAKLHANNNQPLQEDDDLPLKHRLPKPRLPPSGKISSPRKRPVREPGPGKGHPRKKMKLNEEGESKTVGEVGIGKGELLGKGKKAEKVGKEREDVPGMISPESLEAT